MPPAVVSLDGGPDPSSAPEPSTPPVGPGDEMLVVDNEAAGSGTLTNKHRLKSADGTVHFIEDMALPDSVKTLLSELDLDASGEVSEQNLKDTLRIMKQLKNGLDHDGTGITNEEMEEGVELLTMLTLDQKNNTTEMAYKHLPDCIQEVMAEWDTDGSGKVGAAELAAAAQAYKKIQKEGRLMRKIILALTLVILLLMASMFVLSYLAVDMAKEMRGSDDGVMSTPNGETVKMGSSDFELGPDGTMLVRGGSSQNATCPAGQSCRLLGAANGAGSLKVAASETARRLSSTLPDSAFKELKSLTLQDLGSHSIKVTITSFQRLKLKSSKCGSVVHLFSERGRLTLDDYDMSADEALEGYIKDAGMAELLKMEQGGGFGRKLSATDGMLEGFFNLLDDVEWECESVGLPSPESIPQFYHARIRVKHLHETPSQAFSRMFTDIDGNALMLAGVEEGHDGRLYKTWTEDLVKSGSITAYRSEFMMTPMMQEVRVKKDGLQISMDILGSVGYHCVVDEAGGSPGNAGKGAPTMEFVGVVVENGTVLRHYRMYPLGDIDEDADENSRKVKSMVESGMVPDTVDYFDVDTDESGAFEPGQPYRVVMFSSVPGSKVYTEKQYLSITALPVAFEMEGLFDVAEIYKLDTACKDRTNTTDAADLISELDFLTITNRSLIDPNFKKPPPMHPWLEVPSSVRFHYDKLLKARMREPSHPGFIKAKSSRYWRELAMNAHNTDAINASRFVDNTHLLVPDTDIANETESFYYYSQSGRRLGAWSRSDNGYKVKVNQEHMATRAGLVDPKHDARRLAHARRLAVPQFEFEVTPEKIDINVELGACKLEFVCNYCNLYNPTMTDWGACQTGRAGAGDIVKLEAYASGKQVIWPLPKVQFEMGGLLVYDDTSAMGVELGSKMFLNSVGARGKKLEDRYDVPGMHSDSGNWQKFIFEDASGGMATVGTDMRVFIKSHRGEYLSDSEGDVKLFGWAQDDEKWRVLDAGGGKVYLQSPAGRYLGVRETGPQPDALRCTIRIFRDYECEGSYREYSTTSSVGQEFHFSDDNWESAQAFGDCSLTEFFDEDEDETMYEDNFWKFGTFGCVDFPSDLDDDMSGLKIWAMSPPPPEWVGEVEMSTEQGSNSQWNLILESGSSAVSFGDPMLYGGVTISKDIVFMPDVFEIGFTTELGAAYSVDSQGRGYIAEVYGKSILEVDPLSIYSLLKFNPNDPFETKYRDWTMTIAVGYELDLWVTTYRDEYTIAEIDVNL